MSYDSNTRVALNLKNDEICVILKINVCLIDVIKNNLFNKANYEYQIIISLNN